MLSILTIVKKRVWRRPVKATTVVVVAALLFYAAGTFVSLDPDVRQWSQYGRAIFTLLTGAVALFIAIVYDAFDK